MTSSRVRLTAVLSLILASVLLCPASAPAVTLTVTDFGDTVPGGTAGQLRKLINDASPGDTIVIPAATITLTGAAGEHANASGDLDINKNLTIQGAGAGVTIIDAGRIDRVFHIDPSHAGIAVHIRAVTIRNGDSMGFLGGGVFVDFPSTLTLTDCTISGSSAPSGGGIFNSGGATLTITGSTISGNTATNSIGFGGGGILTSAGASLTLVGSTISENTSAADGGGIVSFGGFAVTNVTVSGNRAAKNGGGIFKGNTTETIMNNTTIADNAADSDGDGTGDGGGIAQSAGTVSFKNTLIAGNTDDGGQAPDCSGTLTSQGFNLIQAPAGCTIGGVATGNLTGVNPNLGPLANNGGPTQTHALLAGSPAIDAGTNTGCPPTDQRGVARPQGAACDIGAYEAVAFNAAEAEAFITRLYQQVLSREPDAAGLQAFVDQIAQFGSVVPTVLAFFHSPEFLDRNTSNEQFLTILYHTFLNREPDPAGFAAFFTALQAGVLTRDNLLDIFIDSQEFAAQASFLPPLDPVTAFVTTLYVRILGRGPDLAGLQGFVTQLNQTRTVLPTVQFFLNSSEFLARNTTNTEFVTLLYRVFLDRVPDASGLAFFVGQLTQGTATRDQLVLQFAASPEFQAIQHQLFP